MKYNAIKVPDWIRKNAVYQINPRTFTKEGTLHAVISELSFLKELGFDIIYFCPIFEEDPSEDISHWSERQKASGTENPKNPYRIHNYFEIDSEYGSIDDLREVIRCCHDLGMKVLLDLVYWHMGPGAPIMKLHPEFAKTDEDGNPVYNKYHFIELDFDSQGLREYLWTNMVYFIGELDADGFRCDVGDEIPNDFWAEGRRRIQAIKPDAVLINEGFDVSRLANTFDVCYGFSWEFDTYKVFEKEITVEELRAGYDKVARETPGGGLVLRALDTHDTVTDWPQRAEVLMGHDGMEMVQVMNYIIDGVPMVYCGNELADTARVSMFANRFYMGSYEVTDRSDKESPESIKRQQVYKELNELKRRCETITKGTTVWVENSKPKDVLSFVREYQEKKVLFVGNFRNEEYELTVDMDVTGRNVIMFHNCSMSDNGIHIGPYGYIVVSFD